MKITALKVAKDNNSYILSPWPPGATNGTKYILMNQYEEAMGISEEDLFDILDSYFHREF